MSQYCQNNCVILMIADTEQITDLLIPDHQD